MGDGLELKTHFGREKTGQMEKHILKNQLTQL